MTGPNTSRAQMDMSGVAKGHWAVLDRAAGEACHWTTLPLYGSAGSGLIVGSVRRGDGIVAFQTLTSQVNLALRNSTIQQQLVEQATHDSLTGLLNRAAFGEAIETALLDNDNMPLSVLFLDLDDFKSINDTFGHHVGDAVLRRVAQQLRAAVRSEDKCARLGGDEFAVLLVRTDEATTVFVAERIAREFVSPVVVGGMAVSIRASIGTTTTWKTQPPDALLRNADIAMYAAKARGEGEVITFKTSLLG